MRKPNKLILVGIISFVFVVAAFMFIFSNTKMYKEGLLFEKKFILIEIGDPESKVLTILGQPNKKGTKFHLAQFKGHEEKYKKADQSNSKQYLFWYKGIDLVFTVGINSNGNVSVKEYGGT